MPPPTHPSLSPGVLVRVCLVFENESCGFEPGCTCDDVIQQAQKDLNMVWGCGGGCVHMLTFKPQCLEEWLQVSARVPVL